MPRVSLTIEQVRQLPCAHSMTIPEEYLDAMGHMNVMWYTHLFSIAMGSLLQRVGLSWEAIAACQGGTFALESHIRYLSEVRVGQDIEIYTRVLGRSNKRYHVMQFMANQTKSDVAACLEVVGAYVDLQTRRMAQMPEETLERFDVLINQHRQLTWKAPCCGVMRP